MIPTKSKGPGPLLCCFFIAWCASQLFSQGVALLPVTLIGEKEGLNEKDNRFVFMDSEGFTWISSIHGLYRYDGSVLTHYLPDEKDSTSLHGFIVNGYFFEDRVRNIWFSTYDAIHCYLRARDEFVHYTVPSNDAPGYFTGGMDSTAHLWFLWDTLLMTFHLETHRFDTICRIGGDAIRLQVMLDSSGEACSAFVYSTERGSPGFQMIELKDRSPIRIRRFYEHVDQYPLVVRSLYVDNDTSVWIASHYGLVHFNPETTDTSMYSPIHHAERIFFNHAVPMNDSMLFVTSYGQGVYTFNKQRHVFQKHYHIAYNEELEEEPLQIAYKDINGGIWISVTGKGVAYFHPDNVKFDFYKHTLHSTQSTSGINLNSLIELQDHTVFGGSNLHGAVLLEGPDSILKQFNRDITVGWIANNTSHSYLDHLGRLWIITASGPLIRYPDGEVCPLIRDSIFNVSGICETAEHEIVLGTSSGGLYQCMEMEGRKVKLVPIPGIDPKKEYQYLYRHSDEHIYGAADMTALDIIETKPDIKLLRSIPFKAYTLCMVSINEGKDIWIGSDKGIFIYRPETNQILSPEWLSFLVNTIVYGIVPAEGPFVWLSTNQGIIRLDTTERTFQKFHTGHGAGTMRFNPYSFLKTKMGDIWFGSQHGITVIHPKNDMSTVPCGEIHFREILINNAAWPGLKCAQTGASNIDEYQALRLSYAQNTVSFSFAAFDYAGPAHIVYEYRMTTLDTAWVKSGHYGFARYANLRPGDYVFEVRAGNGTPNMYTPIRSLGIHVIAPLYLRAWFIVLLILSALASVFYIYSFNEKRKRKIQQLVYEKKLALEAERLRIANDMHDDLGSGLSALSLRAKLLADQIRNPDLAAQVNEFVGNTNRLSQQIRETIWTINSKNDTVDSLVTRLHQYALDYFESSEIKCKVEIMQEQILTPVSGLVRRAIFLAFKEALHNVRKHAGTSSISVSIDRNEKNQLVIIIRDYGKGFDPASVEQGIGIASMRGRLNSIGGTFDLVSAKDGTQITFTYPL